jgi:hypothetical protein
VTVNTVYGNVDTITKLCGAAPAAAFVAGTNPSFCSDGAVSPLIVAEPTTQDDKDKVLRFMRMVWKSAKKVAFGIRDSNVVAWYCNISSSSLDTNKADADENVGKSCMRGTKDIAS